MPRITCHSQGGGEVGLQQQLPCGGLPACLQDVHTGNAPGDICQTWPSQSHVLRLLKGFD